MTTDHPLARSESARTNNRIPERIGPPAPRYARCADPHGVERWIAYTRTGQVAGFAPDPAAAQRRIDTWNRADLLERIR